MPRKLKEQKPQRTWSMYPDLHKTVSALLEDTNLDYKQHTADDAERCTRFRVTNVMGKFICSNNGCSKNGWTSKTIATVIRIYPRNLYSAKIYYQRCDKCDTLVRPKLDYSYAERIVYWIKVWNGIPVKKTIRRRKNKIAHNESLCEGCKDNCCPWTLKNQE